MNQQEIFDTVAKHLFTQGERSMMTKGDNDVFSGEFCAYRGENGMKCAVGALITDEMYNPAMDSFNGDGTGIYTILGKFKNKFPAWFRENAYLLENLQDIHDRVENWSTTEVMKEALIFCAEQHGLDYSVLNGLSFNGR